MWIDVSFVMDFTLTKPQEPAKVSHKEKHIEKFTSYSQDKLSTTFIDLIKFLFFPFHDSKNVM